MTPTEVTDCSMMTLSTRKSGSGTVITIWQKLNGLFGILHMLMAIPYRYLFPNSRSSRYQYYAPIRRGDDIIILLYVIYDLIFSEYVLSDTVCEKLLMFNQPSFLFDYVKIELNNYNRVRQLLFTVWIVTGSNQ